MTGSQPLREPGRYQGGHGARKAYSPAVKNPRLERLSYEFRSLEERHDFSRAAAWEGDLGDFRCRLDQGTMEARPRAHYTSADAARQALERHLRAWELWAELTNSIRVQFPVQVRAGRRLPVHAGLDIGGRPRRGSGGGRGG
jgi:hypothetical protein